MGWDAGTVEDVWYREAKWHDENTSCPYRVLQKSVEKSNVMFNIPADSEAHIRVLCHSKIPRLPLLFLDVPLPEPVDPLAYLYLYRPFPENGMIQVSSALDRWKESLGVDKIEVWNDLGENGTLVSSTGIDLDKKDSPVFFLPKMVESANEHRGVPSDLIVGVIAPSHSVATTISRNGEMYRRRAFLFHFPEGVVYRGIGKYDPSPNK